MAILLREEDARSFADALIDDDAPRMSALTIYELRIVLSSRAGERGLNELNTLMAKSELAILPFDEAQSVLAFSAYRRFGKGRHAAGLNLSDCAAYALAMSLDAPLLFKGADFAQTDVRRVL